MIDYARPSAHPTHIRHVVIGATAFAAFLMYLDRICLSMMVSSKSLLHDLGMDEQAKGRVLGVFFLAYALSQMPAGWLTDRFSTRPLLSFLIGIWSFFTLLTGFATGFWSLVFARVGCGMAEAGAYPASGKLVPRWVPLLHRGRANGVVSAGGRLGGAWAPILTAFVMTSLGTWRTPGRIFGAVGICFALVYWLVFRDRPSEHPLCNQAERDLIERGVSAEVLQSQSRGEPRPRIPWMALITSWDMWLMCIYQCLTNVGWAFLVTLMPTFLKQLGVEDNMVGRMATIVLMAGFAGNIAGGYFTDATVRRFGVRRGRTIPLVWTRLPAAIAYFICLYLHSPWAFVAAFAMVAAMTDLGMPAAWGYAQDVGGRSIASVFAWPNMWGNLGAWATANLMVWMNARFDPNHTWHVCFIFLAIAFVLSGVSALGIRADIKLDRSEANDALPRGFEVITGVARR